MDVKHAKGKMAKLGGEWPDICPFIKNQIASNI